MKKQFLLLLIIFCGITLSQNSVKAQSIELLGGSTLNGAMNGVLLGGATMALQNSNEFRPVEVGLGAGTLYGIGLGAYDMSQIDKGEQFYISGTFNDGTNRSIIVLLDTIYGATGGMVVGTSLTLIMQEPVSKGLQYGAGAGAWVGLGFGLIDAFALSEKPGNLQASAPQSVSGLLTYRNAGKSFEIGMVNPHLIEQKQLSTNEFQNSYSPAINVLELQLNL
ncbi:MAG: hypothetical protein ACQEST_11885 [Bacteroidota bacterium]